MARREFMQRLGGALLIPVGLSACAVAPPARQHSGDRGDSADSAVAAALSYGDAKQRPRAGGDGAPRMVVVFLRGAVDGMNVVVPHGDPAYYQARPTIAVGRPGTPNGAIDLTGYFGLHPALRALHPYWESGQLAFVHAAGSPDPSRSHFEAQDYMETGTPGQHALRDGWLNRMLGQLPHADSPVRALTVGEALPRILSGPQVVANMPTGRNGAQPTALDRPELNRAFGAMYAEDAVLGKAYRDGLAARRTLLAEMNDEQRIADNGAPLPNGLSPDAARLGRLMRGDPRIRLGFLALGGWDTHINQGSGRGQLAGRLEPLGQGLATLASELGPAFNDTVIVVVSEFGRTFRENGNGGTDHGHGNVIWLLGGNVRGRRIYGEWPGLTPAALHEGRDLAVTTDFRTVLALLAERHMRVGDAALQQLFPGFRPPPPPNILL
ncbi:DUF1501 domain-containing protein [Oxalobacteraceae bacterium CAVE-383]|nr:DUF1501 domain-containing protein [Oxalobacteraceae bacterium CAVE-383]